MTEGTTSRRLSPVVAAFLLLPVTAPALPADIIGNARTIDGDTSVIGKTHIRLYGIDAPEAKQSRRGPSNVTYLCGLGATKLLRDASRG